MDSNLPKDNIWYDKPELVKKYFENLSDYEQLCSEVAYILKKKIKQKGIEISSITSRTKSLKSCIEKFDRKKYKNPFDECTDFAGIRIIYLYKSDLNKIEQIIRKEFIIDDKDEKLDENGLESFGYNAVHYLVRINEKMSGARYDDLKNLICEIQVRTVSQDAWAILAHHLIYKKESDIPKELQNNLKQLSGLFGTADNEFETIRRERNNYLKKIRGKTNSNKILSSELNIDSFIEFLKWKFPNRILEDERRQIRFFYNEISSVTHLTLKNLNDILNKYKDELDEIIQEISEKLYPNSTNLDLPSSLIVALILIIDNDEFCNNTSANQKMKDFLKQFKK